MRASASRHRTIVMGVLNVTPDSFSDGGLFVSAEAAIARGRELATQGADIIDVGGESTRPGASAVAPDEEMRRVLPVIRGLAAQGIEVSVDTLNAETAAAVVEAGARLINDVSGGTHDPEMLRTAAKASRERGVRFVIGHWRGIPDPEQLRSDYVDVVAEVRDALASQARAAENAGVAASHIIVDPGLGFDKTGAQCWQLLDRLDALLSLGFPVLVGASRKRMIAEVLASLPDAARTPRTGRARAEVPEGGRAMPARDRDLATSVVSAFAARAGVWGVRVHDVPSTLQALAVEHAWRGAGDAAVTARDRPSRDRIALRGLEVFAHHGVFDFERERGQRFLIDAELSVDLRPAAAGDALERTVHYGELAEAIVAAVERDPVDLIETVAERVASVALRFPGVREATITVHKPDAPIPAPFADVSVTVTRVSREDTR